MAKKHTVAVGLNIVGDSGETRYERGDSIPPKHVEPWMIEDGTVIEGDLPVDTEVDTSEAETADEPESTPVEVDTTADTAVNTEPESEG